MLVFEAVEPRSLVRADELGCGPFREIEVASRRGGADGVHLARCGEPLGREFVDRLEHRVARLDRGIRSADETLVHEVLEALRGHRSRGPRPVRRPPRSRRAAHRPRRPPTARTADAGRIEQVVAPVDRPAQGLLPRRCVPRAAIEEAEAACRAAPGSPAGGSRRTRAAASSMASGSPSSRAQIAATAARSRRSAGSRAGPPGADRRTGATASSGHVGQRSAVAPVGEPERRNGETRARPRRATGCGWWRYNFRPGRAKEVGDDAGPPRATCSKLSRTTSIVRSRRYSARLSTGVRSGRSTRPSAEPPLPGPPAARRPVDRSTKSTPSDELVCHVPRELDGQTGLAGAAWSGQGHQPRPVVEHPPRPSDSSSRPMKLVSRTGRSSVTVSVRGAGKRVEEAVGDDLLEPLRSRQALQPMLTEVAEATAGARSAAVSSRVAAEVRTWPPCAAAEIRAARLTSSPA